MCGRFALPDKKTLIRALECARDQCAEEFKPLFNVPPASQVPVVLRADDGLRELRAARWGLVPDWWPKPDPPAMTFNARSEEAADKPTWRDSLKSARCLMPARGWFEWNEHETVCNAAGKEVRQPYYFHDPLEPVLAFAGLWSFWSPPGKDRQLTCALLSRQASPALARIHHRMPVVLTATQQAIWLNPETDSAAIRQLMSESRGDLMAHPVSTRVNSVKTDSADLLSPVQVHPIELFPESENPI